MPKKIAGKMTIKEAFEKWGKMVFYSAPYFRKLCQSGKIPKAEKIDGYWYLPKNTKPILKGGIPPKSKK
jgi:hypothetical protein